MLETLGEYSLVGAVVTEAGMSGRPFAGPSGTAVPVPFVVEFGMHVGSVVLMKRPTVADPPIQLLLSNG
jgi:hypothetical protein